MGLCACNSAGHLSNHADIAPNHAGITFAVSNTIVSMIFLIYIKYQLQRRQLFIFSIFLFVGNNTWNSMRPIDGRISDCLARLVDAGFRTGGSDQFHRCYNIPKSQLGASSVVICSQPTIMYY